MVISYHTQFIIFGIVKHISAAKQTLAPCKDANNMMRSPSYTIRYIFLVILWSDSSMMTRMLVSALLTTKNYFLFIGPSIGKALHTKSIFRTITSAAVLYLSCISRRRRWLNEQFSTVLQLRFHMFIPYLSCIRLRKMCGSISILLGTTHPRKIHWILNIL